MKINYDYLLNIQYKKNIISFITILILLISLFLLSTIKVSDFQNCLAEYNEGYLIISKPLTNSDIILSKGLLKINNKKYEYEIKEYGDIETINNQNYQMVKINVNETFFENEIVNITFYYNEEIILKKIIEIIF